MPAGTGKILLRIAITLLVIAAAAGGWLHYRYQEFLDRPLSLGDDGRVLQVARGTGLRALSDQLVVEGILDAPELFVLYGRLNRLDTRIKAGEYRFDPGMKPPELLAKVVAGKSIQHALTLVEGWTFAQALAAIRADRVLEHRLDAAASAAEVMAAIGHPGEHPEGRLFPDTYLFPRDSTDIGFLQRAYQTMERQLAEAWNGRAPGLPYADPYQALVMASIIEKETAVAAERSRIAGVFIRRLQRGMRLQADPTVIYGLGDGFDGNLKRTDLANDTPYNSYTRSGLPPTPIALPGRAAIEAALHPEVGNWLYFVATGDGEHRFSETLAEHQAAVRKYQLQGR